MALLMVPRLICTSIRERQSRMGGGVYKRCSVDSACLVQFQLTLKKACEAMTHLNLICHDVKKTNSVSANTQVVVTQSYGEDER